MLLFFKKSKNLTVMLQKKPIFENTNTRGYDISSSGRSRSPAIPKIQVKNCVKISESRWEVGRHVLENICCYNNQSGSGDG